MKKFLFPALALGLVLTSCQSDEPFAPGMGEEVQATFTISVPDAMGTRAGEVNSAKGGFTNGAGNLNYTVVLLNDANKVMYSATSAGNGTSATFSPTVVQGYTYKILAYATFDSAVEAPTVGQTIADTDAINNIATLKGINDEKEDAYFCNDAIVGSAEMAATLKRPFGKLRLVATDYDKLQALGTDVASVKVTYGNDVLMEQKFDTYNQAFEANGGVKECSASKAAYSEDAANELTVFVDYLPAGQTGETMYPFTIEVTYKDGKGTYTRSFSQDIPVKRNYLTTLRGDFFTTEAALTLEVNEMFENEETINFVSVSNASQLQDAIENAPQGQTTEIVLNNDIELTGSIVFGTSSASPAPAVRSEEATAAKSFILDLNGKTIETGLESVGRHYYAINNYGTLTLEGNGTIKARGIQNFGEMTVNGNVTITNIDTNGGAAVWNEGRLTINNGTFTTNDQAGAGSYGAALNTRAGGETVVNGGRFEAYSQLTYAIINEGETTINNATVIGKHGAVAGSSSATTTINGGSFELMENPGVSDHCAYYVSDIKGGSFTLGNNTDSGAQVFYESVIADGYEALKKTEGNKYYVVPTTEADVVVTTADELVEALGANKGVYLLNDIKIDPANMSNAYGKTGINVKNGQTIDGGGHTLNIQGAGGTWDSGINTTGGLIKNITVTGSFRGIFINHTSTHSEKVVLENVTIGGNGTVYTISCDQGLYQGIEATNCTFNGWTSFAKTAGEAKFVNCSFGEGSGYKYCRPYSNTEFVNCTFCPGYAVDTTRATVTFTDCTWEE